MSATLRVLVVESDPEAISVADNYLQTHGHQVEVRSSGREARDALRDEQFDLLIGDMAMLSEGEFETLRAARAAKPDMGIILMSDDDDSVPLSRALQAGADGHIRKPLNKRKFSLIFEKAYWTALARDDWWKSHQDPAGG